MAYGERRPACHRPFTVHRDDSALSEKYRRAIQSLDDIAQLSSFFSQSAPGSKAEDFEHLKRDIIHIPYAHLPTPGPLTEQIAGSRVDGFPDRPVASHQCPHAGVRGLVIAGGVARARIEQRPDRVLVIAARL